jgi:hypothetical protein
MKKAKFEVPTSFKIGGTSFTRGVVSHVSDNGNTALLGPPLLGKGHSAGVEASLLPVCIFFCIYI